MCFGVVNPPLQTCFSRRYQRRPLLELSELCVAHRLGQSCKGVRGMRLMSVAIHLARLILRCSVCFPATRDDAGIRFSDDSSRKWKCCLAAAGGAPRRGQPGWACGPHARDTLRHRRTCGGTSQGRTSCLSLGGSVGVGSRTRAMFSRRVLSGHDVDVEGVRGVPVSRHLRRRTKSVPRLDDRPPSLRERAGRGARVASVWQWQWQCVAALCR